MDLNDYREQIDQIDDQMLELFLKRMEISNDIAAYKKAHDLPILNRQRERDILRDVSEKCGSMDLYGRRFVSNLMELSKAMFMDVNPVPVKRAAELRGLIKSGNVRLPLDSLSPEMTERMREVLSHYD